MGEPAPEMSHHRIRELDEPGRDVADVHDLAGQHEEGDREQRKLIDSGEHPLGQDLEEDELLGKHEARERGEDEREHDGNAERDRGEEDEDECARHVRWPPALPLRRRLCGYCHPPAAPGVGSLGASSEDRIAVACRSSSSSETASIIAEPIGTARKM